MSEHHKGNIGTEIQIDCGCDISDATNGTWVKMIKPETETKKKYTAAIISGSDYVADDYGITVTTLDATWLDEIGRYRAMVQLDGPNWVGHGDEFQFDVLDILFEDGEET